MGYGTMGFAAGVVFAARSGAPCPAFWSGLIGASCFSGTLQFVIADSLRVAASVLDVAVLVFAISFRYAFYGFSLIERWRGIPLLQKLFLINGLSDENYALEASCDYAEANDFRRYCLYITALNQSYWFLGTALGAFAGSRLPIPDKGIEFVMAALFITILTDQIRALATSPANKTSSSCSTVSH